MAVTEAVCIFAPPDGYAVCTSEKVAPCYRISLRQSGYKIVTKKGVDVLTAPGPATAVTIGHRGLASGLT